jgi:flagellar biosynthesis protein FlhF
MADLLAAADRYAIFRPSKLILTRSDETGTLGPAVDLCHHTGLPVSFLGTGQQIPEDLEEADARRLAAWILGQRIEPGEERSTWAAA